MFTCPKGHPSQTGDYCDECGALIGAAPGAAPTPPAAVAPSSVAPGATSDAAASDAAAFADGGAPDAACPECGTARAGRFCEVCGHDFVLAGLAAPDAAPSEAARPGGSSPEPSGAPGGTASETAAPDGWRLVASADRAYHARMQARADADAEPIPFPEFLPERRFTLSGARALIGRPSRSRGIEPEVDLSGPPIDPAVSHAHALLVARSGGWSVVDLQSSNGTYVNDDEASLAPHTPRPLRDGDVIYVGAWTALTLRAPHDQQ